jgi:ribosomal protein S18 acetylase RimI-like enzyme
MIHITETKDALLIASLNEDVQNLHAEIHPEMFKRYNKTAMEQAIAEMMKDPDCRAFVAMKDAVAIGYILLFIREAKENAFHYTIRSLYIDQIAALPGQRRSGAGKLLMEQAEKPAKELDIKKLELDHWSANTVAAAYFRKNGYELCKERLCKFIP